MAGDPRLLFCGASTKQAFLFQWFLRHTGYGITIVLSVDEMAVKDMVPLLLCFCGIQGIVAQEFFGMDEMTVNDMAL